METLKVEVEAGLRHRLRQFAQQAGKSETSVVAEALDGHLALQELSQYREIKLSLTDSTTPVHTPRGGSVDEAGAVVRIAAIEHTDGSRRDEHISAETFDRVLDTIFDAVDEAKPASAVGNLSLRLRPAPDRRVVEVHVASDRDDLALDAPPAVMAEVADLIESEL